MVNVQQTLTDQQVKMLMRQLRRIATALEDPRPREVSKRPPAAAAARNLDYVVLRQQMGRERPEGEPDAIGYARRKRAPGGDAAKSIITLGPLPTDVVKLAVFTQRGEPAEVVSLAAHPTPYTAKSGTQDYQLKVVANDQVITRLEFRDQDDHPLALGPRLLVV